MEGAAFRLKSQRTCTRINQHQPPDLTLTKSERATAWGMEGEWMLMALKTPMGIVCCCIHLHCHWPPLSLSRSGCLSFPKPLWADHPLLLQLLTALTIRSSLTLCLSSTFHSSYSSSHFLPLLSPSPCFLHWASHSFLVLSSSSSISPCSLASSHLFPPSHSSLTH